MGVEHGMSDKRFLVGLSRKFCSVSTVRKRFVRGVKGKERPFFRYRWVTGRIEWRDQRRIGSEKDGV